MRIEFHTTLYPSIGRRVKTPRGVGVLTFCHKGRAGVVLNGDDKLSLFDPLELTALGGERVPQRRVEKAETKEAPPPDQGALWRVEVA